MLLKKGRQMQMLTCMQKRKGSWRYVICLHFMFVLGYGLYLLQIKGWTLVLPLWFTISSSSFPCIKLLYLSWIFSGSQTTAKSKLHTCQYQTLLCYALHFLRRNMKRSWRTLGPGNLCTQKRQQFWIRYEATWYFEFHYNFQSDSVPYYAAICSEM